MDHVENIIERMLKKIEIVLKINATFISTLYIYRCIYTRWRLEGWLDAPIIKICISIKTCENIEFGKCAEEQHCTTTFQYYFRVYMFSIYLKIPVLDSKQI